MSFLDKLRQRVSRNSSAQDTDDVSLISSDPLLLSIKPREYLSFHSDYFIVDGMYCCILSFFHHDISEDDFGAFWGVNRIPTTLGEDVTVMVFEQVKRYGEAWIKQKLATSERIGKSNEVNFSNVANREQKRKISKNARDMDEISAEFAQGASYLNVHNRLYVKAKSLEALESTLREIDRVYIDRFSTLKVAPFHGEQRRELANLLRPNAVKRGKGFDMTSVSYGGSHSYVTNGLSDDNGEYVGDMIGDMNTSAVIFDVNKYDHHVVIANNGINTYLNRSKIADMWASKISQAALLNNHKVAHLVLNGANLDILGPRFETISRTLDMNSGDVNMFEMFGSVEDELSIFPAHLDKIVLMTEQVSPLTDDERSIVRGSLRDVLTEFYVDSRMWHLNAKEHRDELRIVGIPHDQVPQLFLFVNYLKSNYERLAHSSARDNELLHAYSMLHIIFRNLLQNHDDLFNTTTSPIIDDFGLSRRTVYDFGQLMLHRDKGIAMAQLVNIAGFATDRLGEGDVLIIHGAEYLTPGVKEYLTKCFDKLYHRGGRVVFTYGDIDKMVGDNDFNRFADADYTILGSMRENSLMEYQRVLGQTVSPDLASLITRRDSDIAYLRRGFSNVVFWLDLALGINPNRTYTHRGRVKLPLNSTKNADQTAMAIPASESTASAATGTSQKQPAILKRTISR